MENQVKPKKRNLLSSHLKASNHSLPAVGSTDDQLIEFARRVGYDLLNRKCTICGSFKHKKYETAKKCILRLYSQLEKV